MKLTKLESYGYLAFRLREASPIKPPPSSRFVFNGDLGAAIRAYDSGDDSCMKRVLRDADAQGFDELLLLSEDRRDFDQLHSWMFIAVGLLDGVAYGLDAKSGIGFNFTWKNLCRKNHADLPPLS